MIRSKEECYLQSSCKKFCTGKCGDAESSYCPRLSKIDYLYNEALIPIKQRKRFPLRVDADGTDKNEFLQLKAAAENIEQFIENGANLYIYSQTAGNGKSSWGIRLIQAHIENIWYKTDLRCRALFVSVPRYLLAIKNNISRTDEYAEHINKNIFDADIVVFDDIATKGITQFEAENLFSIIDTRMNMGKSNVFTSNIIPAQLNDLLGPRLTSRIINLSTVIQFRGRDKRGAF